MRRATAARKSPGGEWQRFATLGSALTAVGALVFTGLTYSAGRDQDQQNRDRQLVDRFSTAATQLGAAAVEERIGGIYALKRLAADSPRDRRTVYEVLAGFVRSRSSIASAGGADACRRRTHVEADVQAALDALATRAESGGGGLDVVDLHETCLASAQFEGADFTNADMSEAILTGARITGKVELRSYGNIEFRGPTQFLDKPSDFSGANLTGADLSGIRVMGAIFRNARLGHADMRGIVAADFDGGGVFPAPDSKVFTMKEEGKGWVRIALKGVALPFRLGLFLDGAYLGHVDFAGTDLGDTSFRGANLTCANFTAAKIDLAWFEGTWTKNGVSTMSDAVARETIKSQPELCGG
jgi:uncharacterized protein YjbI with pentapeptide repeats